MGITILPQTFTGKFDEMNQQLVKIANAQSTASGGIADAVNLANQATQSAEAKIVDVESRFNTLTSAQQGDSEVVDARKGEVSLRAKIDKIDTAHIAHLADTAPHAELIDRTITVGSGKDFTTIQAAIDSIKKRVDATITIQVDAGTYDETVAIAGFIGKGSIYLKGSADLASAVNYVITGNLYCRNSSIYIDIRGFKFTGLNAIYSIYTGIIDVKGCSYTQVMNSIIDGSSATYTTGNGLCVMFASVRIMNSTISNIVGNAVCADINSIVNSNKVNGSGNTTGLSANGAILMKFATQPEGTTAEVSLGGGVIR